MQATPTQSSATSTTLRSIAVSALVAAVGGSIAAFIVARIAIALGADSSAQQLQPGAYVIFTIFGVVIGALGWSIVRRRANRPRHTINWLLPTTVLILFIPDILLGVGGASWGVVGALMVMHVAVAAVAAASYQKFMPLT